MITHKDIANALIVFWPDLEFGLQGVDYDNMLVTAGVKPPFEEVIAKVDAANSIMRFKRLRFERNQRLAESDWTQMPDAPVDKTAWAEYRQALRDLPENTVDPENPVWPTPPA